MCVSRLVLSRLFATPWTVALQALLSMEFSRQEYWSGLPFPSPGDLPNLTQGSNPSLHHCRQILYCLSHQEAYRKIWNASWICLSSLHRGHANLCIVPILVYILPNLSSKFPFCKILPLPWPAGSNWSESADQHSLVWNRSGAGTEHGEGVSIIWSLLSSTPLLWIHCLYKYVVYWKHHKFYTGALTVHNLKCEQQLNN